jgi:hypothetical protein
LDKLTRPKPLLEKLEVGLQQMQPDGNGNCKLVVRKGDANVCSISFEELNNDASDTVLDTEMRLYLIGDLKFLFTMMGRDGHSGSWCIYCVLKQSQWTAIHGDNDEGKCNSEANLWTIEKLHGVAMIQMQKDALDRTCESSGIREIPYWNFVPVTRVIVPILHLLLGLGNDILDSFREWVDVRAKKLTREEVEARQMTMLAELTLDKEVDKLKDTKIHLEFLVVERKIINDSL